MYRRLLPLKEKFICVRQGMMGRFYMGKILDVDENCIELQTYHSDGTEGAVWNVMLNTITEYCTDSKEIHTLALKVKWALSEMEEELAEEALSEKVDTKADTKTKTKPVEPEVKRYQF